METFPLKPCKTVAQAARHGRLDELKRLISKGHPVDVSDNRGWKPIHEAAAENHPDCLTALTNNEVTCVDWQAFDGSTALLEAAKAGNELCLNILLGGKANPNLCDHMSVTPLMAAVQSRNIACVVSLLSHGADINSQQYSGLSALHMSVECDLPAMLSQLLEAGALINIRNDFGITPLFLAAHYGRLECLNVILQHLLKTGQGDVVNVCAEDGASPLFLAAQEGHIDCVRLLLDHGASANITTTDPVALPLHAALEFNHVECVKLLLPQTDQHICSSCTASAFHFSMIHDDDQATKVLIEAGLDFTKCSLDYDYYPRVLRYFSGEVRFGSTVGAISVLAINRNSLVHARALIDAGASLNTTTASAVPPLLPALDVFNLPLAQMLIEHGANINLYHPKVIGNISVIVAVDNWKCLNFVLRCGAEIESLFKLGSQYSRDRLVQLQDSDDDDDYETEPGLLSTPIPFWRMLAENRVLMTRAGITVAKALYRILQFTSSIKLDTIIYSYIDSEEDRKALLSLSGNPRSLMHLCRLRIRLCFSASKLLHGEILRSLPLPELLLDYLQYDDLT